MIHDALNHSITARAQARDILTINHIQLRDFAYDKHQKVDDVPYGGGVGMVFKPEPAIAAIQSVNIKNSLVIHPSPAAPRFDQEAANELADRSELVFIASRYEGLDQRVIDQQVDREYSLGDFVISGGELADAVMIDAIVRLLPGAIGREKSYREDSFFNGLLDYPHYTRPPIYDGMSVPDVLLEGHHRRIDQWRRKQALKRTSLLRPDLLRQASLSAEDRALLCELDDE